MNRSEPEVMFTNCGHGPTRRLEDCQRLHFISAGQGDVENRKPDTFGKQIRRLLKDDILAVYRNKVGYVGIAKVISEPMDINNASLGGRIVTNEIFSEEANMFRNHDNDYKEWLVEIEWLTEVHLSNYPASGKCFGIFATPTVVCRLKNQKELRIRLQAEFNIDFKNYLPDYRD